jgi:two-component system NtrC family response regulator
VGLTREVADRLFGYHWPGNLRELCKVIQAAVALTKQDVIEPESLVLQAVAHVVPSAPPGAPTDGTLSPAGPRLQDVVHAHVERVLASVDGNKRKAARLLGVSRTTLDRKLSELRRRDVRRAVSKQDS